MQVRVFIENKITQMEITFDTANRLQVLQFSVFNVINTNLSLIVGSNCIQTKTSKHIESAS